MENMSLTQINLESVLHLQAGCSHYFANSIKHGGRFLSVFENYRLIQQKKLLRSLMNE
jgi:hypothetical protein